MGSKVEPFDGETGISKDQFFTMLDKTFPRKDCAPFDFELGPVRVHLLLFVHRVTGLTPGLYMFVRDEKDSELLKSSSRSEFLWKKTGNGLPLRAFITLLWVVLLKMGVFRRGRLIFT